MAELKVAATPRTLTGRKVKQLRNQGLTPVVVYGKRVPSEVFQVEERSLERILHSGGMSQLVEVTVDGGRPLNALIRAIQRHPVTHRLTHVDFYAVDMTEKQHVNIPIESTGRASGMAGGLILLQVMDHIMVEALPADIPAKIIVDITPLTFERPITVADLPALSGVQYLAEAEDQIYTLQATREEVEPEPAEVTTAEPEVVAVRGRKDEDEE
jgi:large subunit ribosomal protein L25